MDLTELNGKPLTLWLTDERHESAIFPGIARWDGSTLILDRQPEPFEIRAEWHHRIQRVTNDGVRRILQGAEYFLMLFVGDFPEDAHKDEFEQTGLRWPD
jgi:hypothetical protein